MIFFPGDWALALFLLGLKRSTPPIATPDDTQIPEEGEPDYQPGPIIGKKTVDNEYLQAVDALISDVPKADRFYRISAGSPSASTAAGELLAAMGANTGSNRVRYIKCITQIPWNKLLYASTRTADTWGTMFDVDGKNLSAAWLPRNAPAMQALARKEMPERTIAANGSSAGEGSYYGLVWLPKPKLVAGEVVCYPNTAQPPEWLRDAIGGA